ncbi:MAG: transposase [Phycisphaerales bacterium]|nr:transposase [Phycisphaerales bacterium]
MLRLVDPLLFVLLSATHDELARQVQFLRAENRMLRARLPGRVRLTEPERRRLVRVGSALGLALREIISIVKYETFRRWMRAMKSRKGAPKRKAGPGRPRKAEDLRELVARLATENRGWGYSRLVGELIKLGFNDISRTCIRNILKEHGLEPAPKRCEPTWSEFLKIHAQTLWACDFFTRPVVTLRGWRLCTVLFFMHIRTRRVIVSQPTLHPTHEWSQQQALVFVEDARQQGFNPPTILLKDGDGKFGPGFGDTLREYGCAPKRLPVHSPNLNAFAERWVRSVRRECLDHFVAFGERHLGYLLQQYVEHYHQERPHQGLDNRLLPRDPRKPSARSGPPPSRAEPSSPEFPPIVCRQRLGGVLKHYCREVA